MEEKSLIEIAIEWVKNQNKKKNYTIKEIAKKVFEKKGLKISENKDLYAQFQMDFMLCGDFLSCGEDEDGNRLWNLKYRFRHEEIEKDSVSNITINDDADNKEVADAELNTTSEDYNESGMDSDAEDNDDEPEETEELDDIEQDLISNADGEDVEEDNYDDQD